MSWAGQSVPSEMCHSQTLAEEYYSAALSSWCSSVPRPWQQTGNGRPDAGSNSGRPRQGLGDPGTVGAGQVDPAPPGGRKAVSDPVHDADGFAVFSLWEDQQALLATHPANDILRRHPFAAGVGEIAEGAAAPSCPCVSIMALKWWKCITAMHKPASTSISRHYCAPVGRGSSFKGSIVPTMLLIQSS